MKKLVLVALLGIAGCHTISGEALNEIDLNAVAVDANLRDWDSLTDAQKKKAHWAAGRGYADLRFSCEGVPVPPAYVGTGP